MAQIERQQTVLTILRNLRDLGGLKKLFWEELNYECENQPLSTRETCAHRRRHLVGRVHNSGPPIPAEDLPISSNTSTAGGALASLVNRAPGWGWRSPKTSSSATKGGLRLKAMLPPAQPSAWPPASAR